MSHDERGIACVERIARRAERRIRSARCARVGARALCAALAFAVVDVSLRKVGVLGESTARGLLAGAAAWVALATAIAWSSRLPVRAGARALDRFHRLHDRLASALAFAERPAQEQTPLMRAAIEDAIALAPSARPAHAVPLRLPRACAGAAGLAAMLLVVTMFEVRAHPVAIHAKTIDPIEMAPDDLEDVKDFLKQIDQRQQSDETKAAIDQFNRLVADIANRRLDRTEAFRRLEALEEKLLTGIAADGKALGRELEALGDELKKADLTRPAGTAIADDQLARARDALRELANKMRSSSGSIDKEKLDQLRDALRKAAAARQDRQSEVERRRAQLADEILRMKERMQDSGSDEERSLLDKKERELERLDRNSDEQHGAGQQLDRLDRELEQAAEDLMKDLGLTAKDLDQGAEDLNRMDQEEASDHDKEALRQKLQELRELLRQQGQAGKSQIARLKRFSRAARGQRAGQSGQSGDGPPNDGSNGQSGSQEGDGQQGASSGQSQAGQGSSGGQGGQEGETWIVGPNGEKILMLTKGTSAAQGSTDTGGGSGEPNAGRWGEGHDRNLQGKATNPQMETQDTQVQGAASGQGGSRSQVILGAAERGFASRSYEKVYTEYRQVAEQSLARDDIPGGYRFYVKRYFQLIRPRETP